MSVIHWSATELGEVAACASRKIPHAVDEDPLKRLAATLTDYSRANTNAFNATYRDNVKPVSTMDILREARERSRKLMADGPEATAACERATSTANLLGYNAVANDGRNFLSPDLERRIKPIEHATKKAHLEFKGLDEKRERESRAEDARIAASGTFIAKASGGLKAYKPPPAKIESRHGNAPREDYDRTEAVGRIKKALKARTGLSWSVKNSKSSEGIDIEPPESRQTCFRDGRTIVSKRELGRWWKEHGRGELTEEQAEKLFDSPCDSDRKILADALGFGHGDLKREQIMGGGKFHCFAFGCRANTVARAEGRKPTVDVRGYDYD